MKKSYTLGLMLIILFLFPTVPFPKSIADDSMNPTSVDTNYSIDSQLKNDLAVDHSTQISALLQFNDELTSDEILYAQARGISFKERDNQPIHVGPVYLADINDLQCLDSIENLDLLQVSSAKKQFFTSLDTAVNTINASDVWNKLQIDGHPIDGTGVRVAVIDTGITWQHPSFWRQSSDEINVIFSNGNYYADIDGDSIADPNEGPINSILDQNLNNFSYSLDYMFIDIGDDGSFSYNAGDRWLGGIDANQDGRISLPAENVVILGESKIAVMYDQEHGEVFVRGVNLTAQTLQNNDYHGHGTHVASTIAGGQIGMIGRVGVAPNADLIIIRSLLNSGDIIDAINFALNQDADVINMSFSSYLGFLDGTDIEDLVITESFLEYGTLCTLAAGNLGEKSKHAYFEVTSSSSSSVDFSVGSPPAYSFINILWNSENQDEDITLKTPSGASIDLGTFSDIEETAFRIEYDDIIANVFCDVSLRGTCRVIIQLTDDREITRGDWEITVTNPVGKDINVDVYVWDNEWSYNGLRLTNHLDNFRTISSPATSDFGIAVSSYSESAKIISSSSSFGPRIDGIPKPEIAAPGLGITAASNSLHSLWSTRSGTSMASPQVAGVIALIRSVIDEKNSWLEYSALIQGAGGPKHHYDTASNSFGYGLADALWSIQLVLDHEFNGSTTFADWAGIETFIHDPVDGLINPSLDMNDIFVLQRNTNFYLAIRFSGVPDFSSDTTFQVHWDMDDNALTGLNGFDYLINLTQNDIDMYEWNGSKYISSNMTPTWWQNSKELFLNIPHDESIHRGSLQFETYSSTGLSDNTTQKSLSNQWSPLLANISISRQVSTIYDVKVTAIDKDSSVDTVSIGWLSFSAGYNPISTSYIDGETVTTIQVNYTGINGLLGILLNVTDESMILHYPPIILSEGLSIKQNILSAYINEDTVAVGLLSTGALTGEVQIDGFLLVERIYLAFKSEFNYWINFTLSGNEGIYPIDVTLSGFSAGEYEVYVVAVNLIGEFTSQYIKTINVVGDNSLIILGGVGIGVIVVIVFVIPRLRKKVDEV